MHYDESDVALCDCHYCQGDVLAFVHGPLRSSLVLSLSLALHESLTDLHSLQRRTTRALGPVSIPQPLHSVPATDFCRIEQNVVIIAACVPTLRPFFRRAFASKGSRSGNSDGSHVHSSHGFKLSSNAGHSGFQRPKPASESEMPLDTPQGIWQTREVTVESEDDNLEMDQAIGRSKGSR